MSTTSINISYPSQYFNAPDKILESLAKEFKGKRCGSGCGFGQRDMQFDFSDKKNAKKFAKECRNREWGFDIIVEIEEN